MIGKAPGWIVGHNEIVTRGKGMSRGWQTLVTHTHTCLRTHKQPDNWASVSGTAEPSELGV